MIRVFIADDHEVVRRGIKDILSDEEDIELAGEASNALEIMAQLYKKEWDILILDITMPGKSGLDALIEIKQRKPEMKVLMLSIYPEEEVALRAFNTGASGYLNKGIVPLELVKAIRLVHNGGKYVSPSLAESIVFSGNKNKEQLPHKLLSEREFQVMCLLVSGQSLSDIAAELFLSIKTVSTYRTRVLEKMKMKSNVELAFYAMRHGLVVQE
ncbi:MAG: response regulator [Ignavibacteria bacterium]